MSNINDKTTVSLFVNGEQAEAAMDRLRVKATDLDKQLQAAMAAGDKKKANKLQRELDKVNKELNRTESAAKGAGIVLNNLSNTSIHGLRNALKYLEKELRMTKPNTDAWRTYAAQIDRVKGRIAELTEELEGGQSAWEKFKNWSVSAWPSIDLIQRGYDNLMQTMHEFVDAYASMDREMANVRKFTGMSAEQVAALNEEFKNIDTRSSREQLNKLAQEAGRLGLSSQEDVLGFVRAADKINVALDDLGDGATLTLSKLTDIFGDKERFGVEQSLLKTGSVINELSQSSSAAAPYIANFAERMSGVGVQAKLTVPQIMALGAVLDSMGQTVEASSTAVSQVLVRMMQDPAKYANVAGIEVERFTRLLREDANEALLTFLDTLNKAGGLDVLAPMFKDMGENGSRAIATLTTLAENIDLVRQRQAEANEAFQEGTSIDKEFDVQNNTVQASIEKAQKRFQELRIELGEKLAPLMAHIISSTSAMAKAISMIVNFCIEHKTVLILLTTAIGSYYAAVGLATIAQKAWTAAVVLGRTAITAFKYTVGLCQVAMIALTHGTKAAGTAFTFLNQTMKANPFGLVIAPVATLTVAISRLFSKTVDSYSAEIANDSDTNCDYLGVKRLAFKERDDVIWAYQSCDWIFARRPVSPITFSTFRELYDRYKPHDVPIADGEATLPAYGWSYDADGNPRPANDYIRGFFYAEDVDTYFVLRSIGVHSYRQTIPVEYGPDRYLVWYNQKYALTPVNVFGSGSPDSDDVDTTEIEFIPPCIMDTDEVHGDMMFLSPSDYSESQDATGTVDAPEWDPDDDSTLFRQNLPAADIEAGEPQGLSEYYASIYVGFWNGTLPAPGKMPFPILDKVVITSEWETSLMPFADMRLTSPSRSTTSQLPKIDPARKFKFSFLASSVPNPRAIFHIAGNRYVCEKITATFTENGMSQLLKGEFYPLLDD